MPRPKQPLQWAKGATQIAAAIKAKFGIECARQHIVNWKKLYPPFPAADDAGRYHIETCFEWVAKYKAPGKTTTEKEATLERAMLARAEKDITDAATAKKKYDILDNQYVEKQFSDREVIGVARTLRSFFRSVVGRNFPQRRRAIMKELGVSVEIIDAFYEKDLNLSSEMLSELERKCAEY